MTGLPGFAFAVVLAMSALLAAIAARRAPAGAKACVDIAALLYAGVAVAQVCVRQIGADTVDVLTLAVLAIAPPALALAAYGKFTRRVPGVAVAAILCAAVAVGVAGTAALHPAVAVLPLLGAVAVLLMTGAQTLRVNLRAALLVIAAALALLASATAFFNAGSRAFSLFAAAAVLGIALAVAPSGVRVEQRRWTRRTLAVRRKR